jgi:hypothetical protein
MDDRVALPFDDHRGVGAEVLQADAAVGQTLDAQLVARYRLVAGDHAAREFSLRAAAELERPRRMLERRSLGRIGNFDVQGHA